MTYFNAYIKAENEWLGADTIKLSAKRHDQTHKFRSGLIKRLEKIDAEQGTDIRMCNECGEPIIESFWMAGTPFYRTLVCKNGHGTKIGE